MAVAIPYMMAASAGIAAIGAIQQGKAAQAAAAFNAQVQTQNAEIARADARMEAAQVERENYLRLGAIRAAQGASGGTGAGSVLDVLADTARQGELERQNVIYRGELAARGYTNTAALERAQGQQAKRAATLRAGTELLSGGSSAFFAQRALNRT